MPEGELMLLSFAAAREDVGDTFLGDGRQRHHYHQLPDHRIILEYHADGRQGRQEDSAEAAETSLDKRDVGVRKALEWGEEKHFFF